MIVALRFLVLMLTSLVLGFAALVTSVLVDTVPWRASGRGVRDDVRRVA